MNGVHNHNIDKPFPMCLGRMVNLFDFSAGMAGNRLLKDKPHDDGSYRPRESLSDVSRLNQFGDLMENNMMLLVFLSVSPTMSIRRKIDKETIPKRDITIADELKKIVVVSLWNHLVINLGQELLEMAEKSPIVAIKSLKVGDFQGVSLSTVSRSSVAVNPEVPEAKNLTNWFDTEGKDTSMASVGAGLSSKGGARSMYSD